jgi:hypothetical protein
MNTKNHVLGGRNPFASEKQAQADPVAASYPFLQEAGATCPVATKAKHLVSAT